MTSSLEPVFTRRSLRSAMTLVEVAVAVGILAMLLGGILASLMQMRRLAAASIAQNAALTIVQGYIEQIKNIPLQQFVNADPTDKLCNPRLDPTICPGVTFPFVLPTLKDQSATIVTLTVTPANVALSTLTGATPGTTPTGIYDNLQTFDMDSRAIPGTDTWATIWPGANTTLTTYPTTVPGKTDLCMNFWVRIEDLSPSAPSVTKAYGVVIVYTYRYRDGGRYKFTQSSVRTIRSAVQTF